jgi:hypothetical protein
VEEGKAMRRQAGECEEGKVKSGGESGGKGAGKSG